MVLQHRTYSMKKLFHIFVLIMFCIAGNSSFFGFYFFSQSENIAQAHVLTPLFSDMQATVLQKIVKTRADFELMLMWSHRQEILVQTETGSLQRIVLSENENMLDVLEQYQQRSDVLYVEPNYLFHATDVTPNDSLYSQQASYLHQIGVDQAWELETGKSQVTVAVIDTGVDTDHPDLKENIWTNQNEHFGDGVDNDKNGYVDDRNGWDFINDISDPNPKVDNGTWNAGGIHHGTVVAGLIAARGGNAQGVAGVTWNGRIMPLRALNSEGAGDLYAISQAIRYAADNGAHVINMSLAGFADSASLNNAIDYAYGRGVVIIAAAGNTAVGFLGENIDRFPTYPACSDNGENQVLGVAALDGNDKKASFSDYGAKCVDLAAPGVALTSTQAILPEIGLHSPYGSNWSGTSFAAPLVAGVVALMISANLELSQERVYEIVLETGDNIDKKNLVYAGKIGVKIDADVAVKQAGEEVIESDPNDHVPDTDQVERDLGNYMLAQQKGFDGIYLVGPLSGVAKRHIIPSQEILYSWGYHNSPVQVFDSLSAYPLGDPVKFRDGFLIKGTEAPVYVVTKDGKRIWITTEETFLGLGYRWEDIYWIDDSQVSEYVKIGEWTTIFQHPEATLFKYQTDARVYLLENGFKRPFSNEEAFLSRGYHFRFVLTLSDTEAYPTGVMLGVW